MAKHSIWSYLRLNANGSEMPHKAISHMIFRAYDQENGRFRKLSMKIPGYIIRELNPFPGDVAVCTAK